MITDTEIENNQNFFEQCAKDYRTLGKQLIFQLVDYLNVELNQYHPMATFYEIMDKKGQIGKVNDWSYFIHGFHCAFTHKKTKQHIEVPLVFGLEFGDLDPFFFAKFIKSTPKYQPLPVNIDDEYSDGKKIINKMLSLGKFERIDSNSGKNDGVVVTDRDKVEIKSYSELKKMFDAQDKNHTDKKSIYTRIYRNLRISNMYLLVSVYLVISLHGLFTELIVKNTSDPALFKYVIGTLYTMIFGAIFWIPLIAINLIIETYWLRNKFSALSLVFMIELTIMCGVFLHNITEHPRSSEIYSLVILGIILGQVFRLKITK